MPAKGSYWDVPWRRVDLTEPPEGEDHDPMILVYRGRRLGLAYSPAEAQWLLRARHYPPGTRACRLHEQETALRVASRSWEEA